MFKHNKKAVVAVGAVAVLGLLKLHFRGGICRVSRDMSGQVVVITGGNAGLGREVVLELVKKGCTIIFGARDEQKSEVVLN